MIIFYQFSAKKRLGVNLSIWLILVYTLIFSGFLLFYFLPCKYAVKKRFIYVGADAHIGPHFWGNRYKNRGRALRAPTNYLKCLIEM